MPVIRLATSIHASIELCFDLARSIDLHLRSTEKTRERAIGGVTSGLIGLDEEVTWEAVHLGIRQRLTSRITAFSRPHHFRDSMVRGAFKRFDHDHFFEGNDVVTTMTDIFDYDSPLGILGRLADAVLLRRHMERLLQSRAEAIRQAAEAGETP